MKKYKCRVSGIPHLKVSIFMIMFILVALIVGLLWKWHNLVSVMLGAVSLILLEVLIFSFLGSWFKYSYSNLGVKLFYGFIGYKKIKYDDIYSIVISNASYNNGYGYGVNVNRPMIYENNNTRFVFPYITLHTKQYPINLIKTQMYSRDLFFIKDNEIICLGICWWESFSELLEHTNSNVYILKDVYLRFQSEFDSRIQNAKERCYIITDDNIVPYESPTANSAPVLE